MSVHSLTEMTTWTAMLALDETGPFTARHLAAATGRHIETIKPWLRRMIRAGFVAEAGETDGVHGSRFRPRAKLHRMVTRPAALPVVDRNGARRPETNGEVLWRTMKMLKRFTIAELHVLASDGRRMTRSSVRAYVRSLKQAGVLTPIGPEGRRRAETVFGLSGLVQGERAPMIIGRNRVFDANAWAMLPKGRDLRKGASHG